MPLKAKYEKTVMQKKKYFNAQITEKQDNFLKTLPYGARTRLISSLLDALMEIDHPETTIACTYDKTFLLEKLKG